MKGAFLVRLHFSAALHILVGLLCQQCVLNLLETANPYSLICVEHYHLLIYCRRSIENLIILFIYIFTGVDLVPSLFPFPCLSSLFLC